MFNLCREKFDITTIIVLDGLTPRYFSEKEKILEKSKNIWDKELFGDSNDNLKLELLKNYGVRFYHQEIVSHSS